MKKFIAVMILIAASIFLVACNNNEDTTIKVYTRDTTSGTRGAFFELLDAKELAESNEGLVAGYVQVESNGSMMSSVNNDENGVGYISLSGLEGSGLKGLKFNNVEASEANVLNGTYTLKRPFMYIRKADADITNATEKALVNAFIAFMNSKDGKEIIKNNDGIVEGLNESPTWDSIKANHPVVLETGTKVEIHFGGSTSVSKIAEKLSERFAQLAPTFDPKHNHTGSGAAFSGTRAEGTLHIGFASRELNTNELTGTNETDRGRIAYDAVVIVVNSKNTTTNVTAEQAKKIYTGEITNWNDLS